VDVVIPLPHAPVREQLLVQHRLHILRDLGGGRNTMQMCCTVWLHCAHEVWHHNHPPTSIGASSRLRRKHMGTGTDSTSSGVRRDGWQLAAAAIQAQATIRDDKIL